MVTPLGHSKQTAGNCLELLFTVASTPQSLPSIPLMASHRPYPSVEYSAAMSRHTVMSSVVSMETDNEGGSSAALNPLHSIPHTHTHTTHS